MTIKPQLDEQSKESVGHIEQKLPVVEIFGPTIQGEGTLQGIPCYFIRLGGCDYRCEWCDTPQAVLPELVRRISGKMTVEEILEDIFKMPRGPQWIVISGGNPALHDLSSLVVQLHHRGFKVSAETQGTRFKPWLTRVDSLAVSPKGPSSGHQVLATDVIHFMQGLSVFKAFLKVVIFDDRDYKFAREVHKLCPGYRMYLSAGNDAGATVGNPSREDPRGYSEVVLDLVARGRALVNRTMVDPMMDDVQVQVQNHVLYWGNERGR